MTNSEAAPIEDFNGIIAVKCLNCKERFIAELRICHEAESGYSAGSYCVRCQLKDPLRRLVTRKLATKLVENQRIEVGCHEANRGGDGD